MKSLPVLLLLSALALAQEQKAEVDLDISFRIPQAKGNAISHTPAVVFTQDGKRMLTATSDGQVAVFDAATRKLVKRIRLPEGASDAISIDPAGRYVAWSRKQGGVFVMDIATEKTVAADPKLKATWIAVSPDAKRVAVARRQAIELRHLDTLKLAATPIVTRGAITNLAWSADGRLLGWTTDGGHAVVRDVAANRDLHRATKKGAMHAIAFHPKSTRVVYGGVDRQVYQYAFESGKEEVISQGQPYWITSLGYSPDGKLVAVGDESCDIWLYNAETKKRLFHNKHHVECWLNSVAWAPDNETFVFGCRPNSLAGRPHLHLPLTRAEAARSAVARESRQRLLTALDAEIGKMKDDKKKAVLKTYRDALAEEEKAQFLGTIASFGLSDVPLVSAGGAAQAPSAGVFFNDGAEGEVTVAQTAHTAPPKDLPPEIRKLAEAHAKTVDAEMKKLQSQFCVNQWKVNR